MKASLEATNILHLLVILDLVFYPIWGCFSANNQQLTALHASFLAWILSNINILCCSEGRFLERHLDTGYQSSS